MDPNSYANCEEILTKSTHLAWKVDFESKRIIGSATHTMVAISDCQKITLDSSKLSISGISVDGTDVKWDLDPADIKYGSRLNIYKAIEAGSLIKIEIRYSTSPDASAIQWLDASQTVGKKFPYVFTQCQAIHARSVLPCQDTPGVKVTVTAAVTVPAGMRALMSAMDDISKNSEDNFNFNQPICIPSYLIALAVGNIEGIRVGPRTTVWSEPESVKAAAWEFAETELFISTAESLLTPYIWGKYDLLLLPSSFPYGGMENPCLTFVTPTLLAGDRSLVDVVAHEIAHSWMGNLVTSKTWEHFWLNEGFTVYIERKIAQRIHGKKVQHFNSIIGLRALKVSVDGFKESNHQEYSCLCPNLHGKDPDDCFSSVPYEKGYNLLMYLEGLVEESLFERFVKFHVQTFSFASISTKDFKDNLYIFFAAEGSEFTAILDGVDWDSWFYSPGMPIIDNKFDNSLAVICESLADEWDQGRSAPGIVDAADSYNTFNSNQKIMFFEKLLAKEKFDSNTMKAMNEKYHLHDVQNAEIKSRWYQLAIKSVLIEPTTDFVKNDVLPGLLSFVTSVGRMKFVRPIYKALKNYDLELARDTFRSHSDFYHPICRTMVSKDLMLEN